MILSTILTQLHSGWMIVIGMDRGCGLCLMIGWQEGGCEHLTESLIHQALISYQPEWAVNTDWCTARVLSSPVPNVPRVEASIAARRKRAALRKRARRAPTRVIPPSLLIYEQLWWSLKPHWMSSWWRGMERGAGRGAECRASKRCGISLPPHYSQTANSNDNRPAKNNQWIWKGNFYVAQDHESWPLSIEGRGIGNGNDTQINTLWQWYH